MRYICKNEHIEVCRAILRRRVAAWAESHGKLEGSAISGDAITDADVERLIAERNAAKKARDFAKSDAIRKQLTEAGIIVEDTKDGIRWKRK